MKSPNPDTADQRKLRAFGEGLAKQMQDANYGGVVILSSMDSTSWIVAIPPWSGIQQDVLTGTLRIELKLRKANPELQRKADATIGHLADMRDVAGEIATMFGLMYTQVEKQLHESGTVIDHQPIGSPGKIGPTGKIKS
jgi:hypothetical protein